jgi:membrane protease YdiL (CAAX protease family)
MSEVRTPRRPGVALLGYGTTVALLVAMVIAYRTGVLDGLGWHGGQYAETFLALTGFAVVLGAVLWSKPHGSPWRPFGFGMVLGGLTGGVFVVLLVVLIGIALSRTPIPF